MQPALTAKKVEPKWLHPGAVLENGSIFKSGANFWQVGDYEVRVNSKLTSMVGRMDEVDIFLIEIDLKIVKMAPITNLKS